jgi:hypothetical protein
MRRVRKFFSLSRVEQRLLAEAAVALGAIRVGLWLLPARRVREISARVARWTATRGRRHDGSIPIRVGRAVARASACIPGASCLPQALTAQFLLERRGYSPVLRIGMARGSEGRPAAHAWVEHQSVVILGGGFSPEILLPVLAGEDPDGR